MPAYNVEKYIEKAIESVIAQTYENWELVIINDGSTDKTLEIIERYVVAHSEIRVISQANSGTGCGGRAGGISYLTGEYTQILDADDYLSPDMLEKYAEKLSKNKDLDILIPDAKILDDNGKIYQEFLPPDNDYDLVLDGTDAFYRSLNWGIHGWNCARTSIYKSVDYYSSKLINDDEFATRKIFYSAKNIGFVQTSYFYRFNPTSASRIENPIRKYQYMQTDFNIYQYAVDKKMPQYVIDAAHRKYFEKFVSNSVNLYIDLESTKSDFEKNEYIKSIMLDFYKKNTLFDIAELYKNSVVKKICYTNLYSGRDNNLIGFSKKAIRLQRLFKIKSILRKFK